MSATIDILESFFASWTLKRNIISITDQGSGVAIMKTCDPLWLTPCMPFQIDGTSFEVTAIVKVGPDDYDVTFKYTVLPTGTQWETALIRFAHGQPIRLNYEEAQNENLSNFLKMYLFDLFDENMNIGTDSVVDHVDRIKLFGLISFENGTSDIEKNTNEVYRPMRTLMREIAQAWDRRYGFNRIQRARLINHPDFGIYLKDEDKKNMEAAFGKNLFDQVLGGVELEASVEVLITCNNNCV